MPIFIKNSWAIRSSPRRIVLRHFADQLPNVGRDPRTTRGSGFPLPEQPKSFPMPADQCIGFHHGESVAPFEESRELSQSETSGVGGSVGFCLSLYIECELLAQKQIHAGLRFGSKHNAWPAIRAPLRRRCTWDARIKPSAEETPN